MNCFETASIIISSLAAAGTIGSSIVALFLAKYPKRLKLKIETSNDVLLEITNRSAFDVTIKSLFVSINKKEYKLNNLCSFEKHLNFPILINQGEILQIFNISQCIYDVIEQNAINRNYNIDFKVYDSLGRHKKIPLLSVKDYKSIAKNNCYFSSTKLLNISKTLNQSDVCICIAKNKCIKFPTMSGSVDINKTVIEAFTLQLQHYQKLFDLSQVEKTVYQKSCNDFAVVFPNGKYQLFSGNYEQVKKSLYSVISNSREIDW